MIGAAPRRAGDDDRPTGSRPTEPPGPPRPESRPAAAKPPPPPPPPPTAAAAASAGLCHQGTRQEQYNGSSPNRFFQFVFMAVWCAFWTVLSVSAEGLSLQCSNDFGGGIIGDHNSDHQGQFLAYPALPP